MNNRVQQKFDASIRDAVRDSQDAKRRQSRESADIRQRKQNDLARYVADKLLRYADYFDNPTTPTVIVSLGNLKRATPGMLLRRIVAVLIPEHA